MREKTPTSLLPSNWVPAKTIEKRVGTWKERNLDWTEALWAAGQRMTISSSPSFFGSASTRMDGIPLTSCHHTRSDGKRGDMRGGSHNKMGDWVQEELLKNTRSVCLLWMAASGSTRTLRRQVRNSMAITSAFAELHSCESCR